MIHFLPFKATLTFIVRNIFWWSEFRIFIPGPIPPHEADNTKIKTRHINLAIRRAREGGGGVEGRGVVTNDWCINISIFLFQRLAIPVLATLIACISPELSALLGHVLVLPGILVPMGLIPALSSVSV